MATDTHEIVLEPHTPANALHKRLLELIERYGYGLDTGDKRIVLKMYRPNAPESEPDADPMPVEKQPSVKAKVDEKRVPSKPAVAEQPKEEDK